MKRMRRQYSYLLYMGVVSYMLLVCAAPNEIELSMYPFAREYLSVIRQDIECAVHLNGRLWTELLQMPKGRPGISLLDIKQPVLCQGLMQ